MKSREEILASLDAEGNLEGMPFMPEMLKYCGLQFRVYKRAHKTCDFSSGMEARRVPSTVHLDGLRCSGEAHGGCQAECLLYWKEAWLRPVGSPDGAVNKMSTVDDEKTVGSCVVGAACTEERLHAATIDAAGSDPAYSCQATRIPRFTTPLSTREVDQYIEAYASGNIRLREIFPSLMFRAYARLVRSRLGATGIPQWAYDVFQALIGGTPYPDRPGEIPMTEKTPVGEILNLAPGEYVRVKSFEAILRTTNSEGRNRGLLFSQEMVPYCGQIFRVRGRVSRIVDEKSRRMLHFKNECITLENVVCGARYNAGMSFCPRSTLPYWREIWLERIDPREIPRT